MAAEVIHLEGSRSESFILVDRPVRIIRFPVPFANPGSNVEISTSDSADTTNQRINAATELLLSALRQPDMLGILREQYKLKDAEAIRRFLAHNDSLLQILMEVRQVISRYFENATCELELDYDLYEGGSLVVFIVTHMSAKAAFETLRRLDLDWWIQRKAAVGRKLSIQMRFYGDE